MEPFVTLGHASLVYQEVVSECTVLAALEDEGAEGSEAEAYTFEDEAVVSRDPVVLEEFLEVDFLELDRTNPNCWDNSDDFFRFLGGYSMTVLSLIFFQKKLSRFSKLQFLKTKLNIKKKTTINILEKITP